MSKPVKVSNELYAELRRTAQREGIEIQEALRRRMDAPTTKVAKLSEERDKLSKALRTKSQVLKQAEACGKNRENELETLRGQLAERNDELGELENKYEELFDQLFDWEDKAERSDAEVQRATQLAVHRKGELNFVILLVGIAVIAGAALLFRWRMNRKEAKQKPQIDSFQQPIGWPGGTY